MNSIPPALWYVLISVFLVFRVQRFKFAMPWGPNQIATDNMNDLQPTRMLVPFRVIRGPCLTVHLLVQEPRF